MQISLRTSILVLTLLLLAANGKAFAQARENFLVLGVIASNKDRSGIALMKNKQTGKTFALKEGGRLERNASLFAVTRKSVKLLIQGKIYELGVGDDTATALQTQKTHRKFAEISNHAIEKKGNVINVSGAYKEHLINNNLGEILMQAAAVPHMKNGKIAGFELWEIEKESVFDMAGFQNGDIVTSINGYEIRDVGTTIRQLNKLRSANEARFQIQRNGVDQEIKVIVN